MTQVINPWHWLNEDGSFHEHDARLRNKVIRVAQCIEYGGPLARGEARETLIACRRRPRGAACPGLLWVLKQVDDAILAFCSVCKSDEYLIYEWEGTLWANGAMDPVQLDTFVQKQRVPVPSPRARGPNEDDELLTRALSLLGSSMTPADLRRLVVESRNPTAVVRSVLNTLPKPLTSSALQRFVTLLMTIWNQTPRVELGGQAPAGESKPKVGRNAPCPCGSGKKHKRCCGRAPQLH